MVDMNIEENRLRTFHAWPSNAPADAERLARGGFFATGNYLETQCNWCQKKISDWQYGDQIMVRHRRLDPLCPFVLNPTSSGNITLSSSSSTTDVNAQESIPLGDLKNETVRLATFKNWPNPNISPQSLAKAGFYYLNKSDQVKCAWCRGVVARWEKGDSAFGEHQRFFPDCPRVQLGPLIEIASDGIRDLGIQQICPPRKPKYSSLDARLRTYIRWPIGDIQKPEVLAQAGFYSPQINDQVRCFHCNGGLRSWQKEDDPWFEHAKWFPHCQFIRLVKGPAYVSQVQEIGSQSCMDSTRESVTETLDHVLTLDEAMLTDPVRRALEMGLNEGRIRNATRRHLEYTGKPFDTTEELVEAVLDRQADEEDEDSTEQSSTIVREVSRILNNIFNPRNATDDDDFDNNDSFDEGDDSLLRDTDPRTPAAATNGIGQGENSTSQIMQQHSGYPAEVFNLNASIAHDVNESTASGSPISNSSSANAANGCGAPPIKTIVKQLSLEEENRQLKDARLCKVCMDEEVGVVFLPCGHLVTCVQCAPGVGMCPLCRTSIKGFVRTFLS